MGLPLPKLSDRLFSKKDVKIVMVGLDCAGKTTILQKLKFGEITTTVPTVGFNIESVEFKNMSFTNFDIIQQENLRPLWKHFFKNVQALIFVIDSSDRERFDIAKEEFQQMMTMEDLIDVALLVFANKQDLNAMSVSELCEKLELQSLKGREWYIQGTSGLTGDGLYEGIDWLSCTLAKKKQQIQVEILLFQKIINKIYSFVGQGTISIHIITFTTLQKGLKITFFLMIYFEINTISFEALQNFYEINVTSTEKE